MNLSHAVGIVLYKIYIQKFFTPQEKKIINGQEKEKLYDFFSNLLETIDYPEHKKENTEVMIRRILGRAMLSKWEYHTLMGVLSKTMGKIQKSK